MIASTYAGSGARPVKLFLTPLLLPLMLFAIPVQAQTWGAFATISETLGVSDSRICIGEASRGDMGCPSFAPTISPTGRLNASAGLTVDTVSLTTGGTTWGYLGSGSSYLPNLNTTNISVSTINGISVTALGGAASGDRIVSGSTYVLASSNGGVTISGSTHIGYGTAASAILKLGTAPTANRGVYIDLIGDTTYTDYGLRIIRNNTGANTTSQIIHRGTGNFTIGTNEAANLVLNTGNAQRALLNASGLTVTGYVSTTGVIDAGGAIYGYQGDSVTAPGYTWSGDTNTGMYWVGADQLGLTAGGTQRALVNSSGVTVTGAIVSKPYNAGSATSIDWSRANMQYTTASCGAFTFTNMADGGSYTLAVQGATSATCSFTHSGLTFRLPPDHGATVASTHTLYSFVRMGTVVYVAWIRNM